MTLLARMDRLVYATRFDRLIFMKFEPRTLRWTPLVVIAALVVGYVLLARTQTPTRAGFFVGWLLFYGAFLAAGLVRVFGPRFRPTFTHPLDERELAIRSRAYAISGVALASFAMLGCFYIAGATLLNLWHPQLPNDWINLGFGFQACGLLLPTLIASWLQPRAIIDRDY